MYGITFYRFELAIAESLSKMMNSIHIIRQAILLEVGLDMILATPILNLTMHSLILRF